MPFKLINAPNMTKKKKKKKKKKIQRQRQFHSLDESYHKMYVIETTRGPLVLYLSYEIKF